MKTRLLIIISVLLTAPAIWAWSQTAPAKAKGGRSGVAPSAPAGAAEDEKAIRATISAFAQAFQNGDAAAIAQLFTEDAEAVDADGASIQGRAALQDHYAARFDSDPGIKLGTAVESVKMIAPGVARETGRTAEYAADGKLTDTTRYTAIHVLRDGQWLIASVRETPDHDLTPADHLKELEWLIGDWVEETEDAVVVTSINWTDDKCFLMRTFEVRVKGKAELKGTQRIGWDPLTEQIKSWVFDNRGGYSDGLWMHSGNQWVVKSMGVRPDGRVATATQVLTYINNDTLRWKSIDRTLGSDIAYDIDEVVMVRRPPRPR
jgi:uncharacterized protein (TIGR02246 family)